MKCPACGANLSDGSVYCDNCGAEIFVVTDLEAPEIQKNMDDALSKIVLEEFEDEDDMEFDEEPNLLSLIFSGHAGGKLFYAFLILVLAGVIVGALLLGKKLNAQNTVEYQLQMAEEALESNNLLTAIGYLENAYKMDKDVTHLFTVADYYYTLGRDNDAIYTLTDIADNEKLDDTDRYKAYLKIITLYEQARSYSKLATLIDKCPIDMIKKNYSKYLVKEPVFNYEGGTYEEKIHVKIASELENGTIYYTLGKQLPTENSDVFDKAIYLEYGSYTINAFYVNEYGVASDVVTQKYLIDVDFVFEPEILLEPGDYNEAQLIEANVPPMYSLYYTTDGTDPSKSSIRYTGPIPLPYGDSYFKFIEYASDGTVSNIVEYSYNLSYETAITSENAVSYLKYKLVERGILADTEGHIFNQTGYNIYIFTTAYNISGKGDFFFIVEYHVDDYGNKSKTGNVYAMGVINADLLYKVTTKKDGSYSLKGF